ncbi:hypothetical protein ES703_02570 [subsurface metagenome]
MEEVEERVCLGVGVEAPTPAVAQRVDPAVVKAVVVVEEQGEKASYGHRN